MKKSVYAIRFRATSSEGMEYIDNIYIRADNSKQAKRIAKQMTGALIKYMLVIYKLGHDFKADND